MARETAWKIAFQAAANPVERAMGSTRNGNAIPMYPGAALQQDKASAMAMAVRTGDRK
jgi:hypothetical protein